MAETTYQVILSTDGKHTVIATTDDVGKVKAAFEWAGTTYDRLVKRYGLKHEQRHGSSQAKAESEADEIVPECAVHHVPMVQQQGKYGSFLTCHQHNPDGSFCSYRPNGQ